MKLKMYAIVQKGRKLFKNDNDHKKNELKKYDFFLIMLFFNDSTLLYRYTV